MVWLQVRMRDIAGAAAASGAALPDRYAGYAAAWFWLGWPAFIAIIAIYIVMIWHPEF